MPVKPVALIVVVGATARCAFEDNLGPEFIGSVRHMPPSGWAWRNGQLVGHARYVIALPHRNARVPKHDVEGNVGSG